jgi:hypothetical protein
MEKGTGKIKDKKGEGKRKVQGCKINHPCTSAQDTKRGRKVISPVVF